MKRSTNKKLTKLKPFSMKWKNVSTFPNNMFTNATEITCTTRDKLDSLDEFIDKECAMQEKVFCGMGCDSESIERAINVIRMTYQSSKKTQIGQSGQQV